MTTNYYFWEKLELKLNKKHSFRTGAVAEQTAPIAAVSNSIIVHIL